MEGLTADVCMHGRPLLLRCAPGCLVEVGQKPRFLFCGGYELRRRRHREGVIQRHNRDLRWRSGSRRTRRCGEVPESGPSGFANIKAGHAEKRGENDQGNCGDTPRESGKGCHAGLEMYGQSWFKAMRLRLETG